MLQEHGDTTMAALLAVGIGSCMTCLLLFMGLKLRWFRARLKLSGSGSSSQESTYMTGTYRSTAVTDEYILSPPGERASIRVTTNPLYKSMPDLTNSSSKNSSKLNGFIPNESVPSYLSETSLGNNLDSNYEPQKSTLHSMHSQQELVTNNNPHTENLSADIVYNAQRTVPDPVPAETIAPIEPTSSSSSLYPSSSSSSRKGYDGHSNHWADQNSSSYIASSRDTSPSASPYMGDDRVYHRANRLESLYTSSSQEPTPLSSPHMGNRDEMNHSKDRLELCYSPASQEPTPLSSPRNSSLEDHEVDSRESYFLSPGIGVPFRTGSMLPSWALKNEISPSQSRRQDYFQPDSTDDQLSYTESMEDFYNDAHAPEPKLRQQNRQPPIMRTFHEYEESET